MRTCVNACVFCFMTMLPKGGRSTLYIRDDDYRLSFLQGNFVTLTNLTDEDVDEIEALPEVAEVKVTEAFAAPTRVEDAQGNEVGESAPMCSRPSWPPASRFTRRSCCAPA